MSPNIIQETLQVRNTHAAKHGYTRHDVYQIMCPEREEADDKPSACHWNLLFGTYKSWWDLRMSETYVK